MILYYFLPVIIALGIITSYQDIKIGKIKNRWILYSLLFALIANMILIISSQIGWLDIRNLMINFGIAIIVSFALWNINFWSAGDAKLFIAYSALIPVAYYASPLNIYFPSFNLFMNTIVIFFAYIIVRKIFFVSKKNFRENVYMGIKSLPFLFISLFSVKWFVSIINQNLFSFNDALSMFLIHAGVYYVINLALVKTIQKYNLKNFKPIYFYIAIIGIRIIVDPMGVFDVDALYSVLWITIIYSLLFKTLYRSVYSTSYKKKRISKLKRGDVLAKVKGQEQKSKKKSILDFIGLCPEGLCDDDLKKIKKLSKKKNIQKTVLVADTAPFAPMMFLGVIFTIVFGTVGNFIYLLKYLFMALLGGF